MISWSGNGKYHGHRDTGYPKDEISGNNMAVNSGSRAFFGLVWSLLKRMWKSDFSAVMLNCNNWVEFWRILRLKTDETCE